MQYTATIETDNTTPLTPDTIDTILETLTPHHAAIGTTPDNTREATLTITATTINTAAALAADTAAAALGGTVIRIDIQPTERADIRRTPLPDLVGPAEAATILGVSRQAVHKRVERGTLRSVRIGNAVGIPRDDLTPNNADN